MTERIRVVCESCKSESEECVFANYEATIDGKEYLFCCKICADKYLSEH
ncbi:MAG: hypothetical protein SVJ22_06000 [Halobacteriota archaeon]|nr:hypothetical protein [Halobacteriota archaeon]MDY6931448.1 hypothetical protein [Halobacteriota archaeon]MDY6958586.1 hypothetical protein [Halobacteriota archaeon]